MHSEYDAQVFTIELALPRIVRCVVEFIQNAELFFF